ncbi:MAG TPA: HAD-IB family hydrolase [Gemmatimonadota bacterium]|nr:HAD-IB family hydrolase [Gemmatimonadota bacterium]
MKGGVTGAFFDVDGTLVASDIVRYGALIRTAEMTGAVRAAWTVGFLPRVLLYVALDTLSRSAFQRAFYRLYRGVPPDALDERARALFHHHIEPRLRTRPVERVQEHRRRGHRVVLVTGSLEPIVAPLAAYLGANDVLAARLEVRAGAHTGRLAEPPLAGERKGALVVGFAREHGIDLAESFGYADSADDVPMLEAVGHPVAVAPDRRLRRIALARGWEVLD